MIGIVVHLCCHVWHVWPHLRGCKRHGPATLCERVLRERRGSHRFEPEVYCPVPHQLPPVGSVF